MPWPFQATCSARAKGEGPSGWCHASTPRLCFSWTTLAHTYDPSGINSDPCHHQCPCLENEICAHLENRRGARGCERWVEPTVAKEGVVSCLLGLHVWVSGRDACGILRQDWELGERDQLSLRVLPSSHQTASPL